jgi:hypothetical protein
MVRQAFRHAHGPEPNRRANHNDQNSKPQTLAAIFWSLGIGLGVLLKNLPAIFLVGYRFIRALWPG